MLVGAQETITGPVTSVETAVLQTVPPSTITKNSSQYIAQFTSSEFTPFTTIAGPPNVLTTITLSTTGTFELLSNEEPGMTRAKRDGEYL